MELEVRGWRPIRASTQDIWGKIYGELVYGGGHMPALDTSALTFVSSLLLGFTPTWDLLLAAYLFTYGSYTLNRIVEWKHDQASNPLRSKYMASKRRYAPIIVALCYGGTFLIAFFANLTFFAALLLPFSLSYLYNIGSHRFKTVLGASKLKEKFLVKNLVVSAGWGLVPSLVLLYYEAPVTPTVASLFIFIFLRILVNTIFCDMKDVKADSAQGIKTIPTVQGLVQTRRILLALNTIAGLTVFGMVWVGLLPLAAHAVNLVTFYGYFYILKSRASDANLNFLSDFVAEMEEPLAVPLVIIGMMLT